MPPTQADDDHGDASLEDIQTKHFPAHASTSPAPKYVSPVFADAIRRLLREPLEADPEHAPDLPASGLLLRLHQQVQNDPPSGEPAS